MDCLFQVPELQRMNQCFENMQRQRDSFNQLFQKAKTYPQDNVRSQVNTITENIIRQAKNKVNSCQKLEKDVNSQNFINYNFSVNDLLYDSKHMPEWFGFVFQKQFNKQRNALSALGKKLFKQHCLAQKIRQLKNQIQSFQNLFKRYQSLSQKQKVGLSINFQIKSFQAKIKMIVDRFVNFVILMGEKVMYFVEDNVKKALNYKYTNGVNGPQVNAGMKYQRQGLGINTGLDQHVGNYQYRNNYRSTDKDKYQSTLHTIQDRILNQNIANIPTRGVSPLRCMNHNYYHDHAHSQVNLLKNNDNVSRAYTHMPGCQHHKPSLNNYVGAHTHMPTHTSTGFEQSRFNYRDYKPRWMNNTLSSYYF